MTAGLLALLLTACTAPAPSAQASAEANTPPPAPAAATTEVDPRSLPPDVQAFILNQRMCRHFRRPADQGGNAAMARAICVKADPDAWKTLLRKYRDDDTIGSILLAERPEGGNAE
ncbi:hypothetical protein EBB59_10015 [Lysobacter pythonis]|uniref:Uncharacterized protein n=1 Tax=Solilutibacter pythonis TaxID=2483112 RepID=A0A3M2HM23_9GAMM|nr:hypothetical protein [Lysobacter pythonis]RMH90771.1 hypothetical protein EBB59_10015 [Lysobacter pythonis]